MKPVVELRGLTLHSGGRTLVEAVDLVVHQGRITALTGPSGSGKTLTARAMLGQVPRGLSLVAGSLRYPRIDPERDWFAGAVGGRPSDLARLLRATAHLRGSYIAYAPQAASSALNPGRTLGRQLEMAMARRSTPPDDVGAAIREALEEVGLPPQAARMLPGEMSGGMCQRAAMAIALAPAPSVLIADEPETGLDPVLTRAVTELMVDLCRGRGIGMVLISHRRATVERIADDEVTLPGRRAA